MRFGHQRSNYGYAPFFKFWADAVGSDWQKWQEQWQEKMQCVIPATNIVENELDFTIELAAPGFQKEDFKIEVKEGKLTIWTEIKEQENTKKYSRREFGKHNIKRTFSLSDKVDVESISAKYTEGILYVVIPKSAQNQTSKTVTIE
jgi:HSP20 family protein